jgi:hypothetical protein
VRERRKSGEGAGRGWTRAGGRRADPHARFPPRSLPPPRRASPSPARRGAKLRLESRALGSAAGPDPAGHGAGGGRAGPGRAVRALRAPRAGRLRRVDRGLGAGGRAAAPRAPGRPLRALHGREEPAHPGRAGRSRRSPAPCRASRVGASDTLPGPSEPRHPGRLRHRCAHPIGGLGQRWHPQRGGDQGPALKQRRGTWGLSQGVRGGRAEGLPHPYAKIGSLS